MLNGIDVVDVAGSGLLLLASAIQYLRWARKGISPAPPAELRALLILSWSLALIDFAAMLLVPLARAAIVQSLAGLPIPSAVFAMAITLITVERKPVYRTRIAWVMLALAGIEMLRLATLDDAGPTATLLCVGGPLACAAVVSSPRVRSYCCVEEPVLAR